MALNTLARDLVFSVVHIGEVTSSVAFAFTHDMSRPQMIAWQADSTMSHEVPTCILFNPDGETANSFGFKGEKEYINLVEHGKHKNYFFVKGLQNVYTVEKSDQEDEVFMHDVLRRQVKATNVLSQLVRCLTNSLLDHIGICFNIPDVAWILTLPSGSSPLFKTIMRNATKMAGIDENKITVTTSTDAVALLFNKMLTNPKLFSNPNKALFPGMHFLTIIAGGESVQSIAHRVEIDTKISELTTLKKAPWGVQMITTEFEHLLEKIVGDEEFKQWKTNSGGEWLELLRTLESKIMSVGRQIGLPNVVTIQLPSGLNEILISSTDIEKKEAYKQVISFTAGKIRICLNEFLKLFENTLQQIIKHIQGLREVVDVRAILMVGKFADTMIFQKKMETAFSDITVVFPEDAELAVIKGSFIFAETDEVLKLLKGQKRPLVVASIDIGTAFSGWCRSQLNEFRQNPIKARTSMWDSDKGQTEKAPTCVLLQEDGNTLEAFGYDAIRKYHQIICDGKEDLYYYFRNFKMTLFKKFGEKLNRDIKIEDEKGRFLPAMNVFSASIRFLKMDCLATCQDELTGTLDEDEIQWVLTVPAIWSDAAKQFMREAGIKAGIKARRLSLVLEPEAASIYCRHVPVQLHSKDSDDAVSKFTTGTKYMILDAGGGTIDITVHEVLKDGSVKEIMAANGGPWGGNYVNKALEDLLAELVGQETYKQFCVKETEDHLDIMTDFEIKKRSVSPSEDLLTRMRLPYSLAETYREITGSKLENDIKLTRHSSDIQLNRDKLTISAKLMRNMFETSIKDIISQMHVVLDGKDIDIVLMVGGYSDSKMLQKAVKKEFPSMSLIIPKEAVRAIMIGATIFGHIPRQITERVLKHTYGVSTLRVFVEGKDAENRRTMTDAGVRCSGAFDKHVEINQSVIVGKPQTERVYTPAYKSQKSMDIKIYASELKDPEFVDQRCMYVGSLRFLFTDHDGDLSRRVKVAFTFSDTEMVAEARDEKTGEETSTVLDFLG